MKINLQEGPIVLDREIHDYASLESQKNFKKERGIKKETNLCIYLHEVEVKSVYILPSSYPTYKFH